MIENFDNIFYLILFLINLVGLAYYGFLTAFNPKQLINDYEFGDDSIGVIRIVGTFVWTILIIGIITTAAIYLIIDMILPDPTFTIIIRI